MSIQRLLELKTRWVNQKKTVSFVEKSPWHDSETFNDLCLKNEYCFALGFIWLTHLNECMGQNELFLNLMARSIQHYHNKAMSSSYTFPFCRFKDPLLELNATAALFLGYEKTIRQQSVESPPFGHHQSVTLTQHDGEAALGGAVQYGSFNDVQSLTDMLKEYKEDVESAIFDLEFINKTSTNSHDQAVMAGFVDDEASDYDGEPFSFPQDKLDALQINESLVEIFEDYKGDIKKAIDTHTKKGMFIITYNNGISHAVSYKKNFDLGRYEFLDTGNHDQPISSIETIDDLKFLVINLYDTYMANSTSNTYIVFLSYLSCFSSECDYHDSKKVKLYHSN